MSLKFSSIFNSASTVAVTLSIAILPFGIAQATTKKPISRDQIIEVSPAINSKINMLSVVHGKPPIGYTIDTNPIYGTVYEVMFDGEDGQVVEYDYFSNGELKEIEKTIPASDIPKSVLDKASVLNNFEMTEKALVEHKYLVIHTPEGTDFSEWYELNEISVSGKPAWVEIAKDDDMLSVRLSDAT